MSAGESRTDREREHTERIAFLRRKPRHLVEHDSPTTLCGYTIPRMARWRIRPAGPRSNFVTCDDCRRVARWRPYTERQEPPK